MLIKNVHLLTFLGINAGLGSGVALGSIRSASNSSVVIGRDSLIACRFSIDKIGAKIIVGDRCFLGKSHLVSADSIVIEDDVIISWGVTIVDHNSHPLDASARTNDVADWMNGRKNWTRVTSAPVLIGRKSWIGFNAVVLKGVTIGEGAVVGACSVVTKDVAPFTVVAGNPARIIRNLRGLQ